LLPPPGRLSPFSRFLGIEVGGVLGYRVRRGSIETRLLGLLAELLHVSTCLIQFLEVFLLLLPRAVFFFSASSTFSLSAILSAAPLLLDLAILD